MIFPSTPEMVLLLSIVAFLCWGVWIATFKRTLPAWRFELYSFDFAIGLALAAVIAAYTFGTIGDELSFTDNLMIARKRYLAFALVAGAVFNLANMLLLAAVSIAGASVAFPIVTGLALIVTSLATGIHSDLSTALFWAGIGLVLVSVAMAILAYRSVVVARNAQAEPVMETTSLKQPKKGKKLTATKGIIVSIVSGVLMGGFIPLIQKAYSSSTDFALGPYAISFLFGIGVFLTTIIYNLYFINLPVYGEATELSALIRGSFGTHLTGVVGGIIWGIGLIAFAVSYMAPVATPSSQLTTVVLGFGGAVIAALIGLFVCKEQKDASSSLPGLLSIVSLAAGLLLVRFAVI